jgi:hypothetical protein
MMRRFAKYVGFVTTGMMFGGLGGGCLPEDFWVNKIGEIVNGIIIGLVSTALDGAGVPFGG